MIIIFDYFNTGEEPYLFDKQLSIQRVWACSVVLLVESHRNLLIFFGVYGDRRRAANNVVQVGWQLGTLVSSVQNFQMPLFGINIGIVDGRHLVANCLAH